ncbi:ferrous iron transport protein A [Aedoeadaptatus acetigenes]|uniref:Ferrous iron transport protein A n=1 Tax=Aedoeadaptatus acetigenes TaxID=2981723 RepID=A0ABV1J810_9FIRM|nr:ferrous iron transport protein A [Aedoeadaptatus acetigenes]MBS6525853.1 ferrous iron transport protein A [Peptoniphilaceae bacterium]MCU6786525.1 ferrous iron transport protein A [Aedoeadaptatus acetigenes]
MNLNEASVDKYYVVKKINGQGPLKRRIMDMGITKNTVLFVRKFAPLGDPIQLTVRGYELSLRKADAELVEVEETQGPKGEEA